MPDRLTGLDASFLHLERGGSHMHVAGLMLFDGDPPAYEELIEATERRLHLVPRYRQKLAEVPFGQGRPVWVDDPHFNLGYHVRRTALAPPGSDEELQELAGRVFSQPLDRDKPLWEMWLVEGLADWGFGILSKTHHALVDGVSGVDIVSVLYDSSPDPPEPPEAPPRWLPRPIPARTELLAEALLERATVPAEMARSVRSLLRGPREVVKRAAGAAAGVGAIAGSGIRPAPPSPYNVDIGPHRRFRWVAMSLEDVKSIKNALGGTVNDVILAVVAGGLGRHLRSRGVETADLELRAMVPVSVRGDLERGALGNRVAAMMAPLPVGCEDPAECLARISESMAGLKRSGQAVGAQVLTELTGFAPPTIMSQAARLMPRQRLFNLVVTNVPGPQFPLYLLGREMLEVYPLVPLAQRQGLGVAIMSYNGRINFGLNADYDAVPDLDVVAGAFEDSLHALAGAAGVTLAGRRSRRPKARSGGQGRFQAASPAQGPAG